MAVIVLCSAAGIEKVSCFTKDNIMKLTDGLFHRVFEEVSAQYPAIKTEHLIVDIGAARLADQPGRFKLVILPNLYGDILSDVAAEIAGSVGLAGSANIGSSGALFEAIHGSAPTIAGKDMANPSGLLKSAIMMLNHIGQQDVAETIKNAWSRTIEEGIHTADIYKEGVSKQLVGTQAFADAVVARLGMKPQMLKVAEYEKGVQLNIPKYQRKLASAKVLKGVDVFVDWKGTDVNELANQLQKLNSDIRLTMITNRGVKIWPNGFEETFCTDHWRCRFEVSNGKPAEKSSIPNLLSLAIEEKLDVIKTENLYEFDGVKGYSLGQGQ